MSSETGQSLGSEGAEVKLKMDFFPKNLTVYGKRPICRQKSRSILATSEVTD